MKLDCSIKLNTTVNDFENGGGKAKFIDNLSISLGIDASTIDISSIREGSVIVDYTITVNENKIDQLKQDQNDKIQKGLIDFGAPVLDFSSKTQQEKKSKLTSYEPKSVIGVPQSEQGLPTIAV